MLDAIVLGKGVAGSATTLALARAGASVALLGSAARRKERQGETLAPEARSILQELGVWDVFLTDGHLPCHGNASSWGWDGLAENNLVFNPFGSAWQLDRNAFEAMLQTAALAAGAGIHGDLKYDLTRSRGHWTLHAGECKLHSRWVVDATGRRAAIARAQGARWRTHDSMIVVWANARGNGKADEDSRTIIEAVEDGWWYTARMPGGKRTAALQVDANIASSRDLKSLAWFTRRLERTRYIHPIISGSGCVLHQAPLIISAGSGRLSEFAGEGWLAVGDAAMCFDPLSGQGIFKALRSGIQAAKAVGRDSAREGLSDFTRWSAETWKRYAIDWESFYRVEQRWPDSSFWTTRHTRMQRRAGFDAEMVAH